MHHDQKPIMSLLSQFVGGWLLYISYSVHMQTAKHVVVLISAVNLCGILQN